MPKGIISMGGAQFQTGRNSMSPMSAFGRNFIVARSLPRRRPRFARAPCQAFYTEIWRMLDAATESRKMLRRLTSRLHLDLEAGGGKHVRRLGGAQSCALTATQPTQRASRQRGLSMRVPPGGDPDSAIR